jgi:hypothetical protein
VDINKTLVTRHRPLVLGRARGRLSGLVADACDALRQMELAASLTSVALETGFGPDPRLYALHHPDSAHALRRLSRWAGSRACGSTDRAPWSMRHTPVVHGWMIGALVRALRWEHAGGVGGDGLSASVAVGLADGLRDLGRLSVERSRLLVVRGVLAGFEDARERGNRRVLLRAERAVAWMGSGASAHPADGAPPSPRLAAHLGACRVLCGVELALALRRIDELGLRLPDALASVVPALRAAMLDIEQGASAAD